MVRGLEWGLQGEAHGCKWLSVQMTFANPANDFCALLVVVWSTCELKTNAVQPTALRW